MNVGYLASNAAKEYLAAAGLTTVSNFYAEMENPFSADETQNNKRELPCVVCFFGAGQEYPLGTGNYSGELSIRIEANASTQTAAQLEAIFNEVWSKISTDTILDDLSSAGTDFTAFGFTGGIQQTAQVIEGRLRTKAMVLPINCCPSDVS